LSVPASHYEENSFLAHKRTRYTEAKLLQPVPQVKLTHNNLVLAPGRFQPIITCPASSKKSMRLPLKTRRVQMCRCRELLASLLWFTAVLRQRGMTLFFFFPGKLPAWRRSPRAGSPWHCLLQLLSSADCNAWLI